MPALASLQREESNTYPWLAGNERMEKKMETMIIEYIVTTVRIHSFIPSSPKVRTWSLTCSGIYQGCVAKQISEYLVAR